ncbi:hypothetical protein DFS34DRAFT_588723 [Phlyctochytrium arcticum]|nr:hypothetical protein DFS34DRAFT_588723 [Phlyctochytrium arcticum]
MAHFMIAGRADDVEYARAELLAHHLHRNLPDFHATFLPQRAEQCSDYIRKLFMKNRWDRRMARDRKYKGTEDLPQCIWRESGELIGSTADFLKLIKDTYGQEYDVEDSVLAEIAQENYKRLLANELGPSSTLTVATGKSDSSTRATPHASRDELRQPSRVGVKVPASPVPVRLEA